MFILPDLPYDYVALEPYIDEATMHFHHDKHHAAYVRNLNETLAGHDDWLAKSVEEILTDLDKVPAELKTKVRNNAGGVANHSMYWLVMAPKSQGGGGQPTGKLAQAIESAFGNFAGFQEQFSASSLGRFGSGWAWLSLADGKLMIEDTPNQDSPVTSGHMPILCLDVWEHAYYLKYQNLRAEYIKNWWNVVNWKEVEKRFAAAG